MPLELVYFNSQTIFIGFLHFVCPSFVFYHFRSSEHSFSLCLTSNLLFLCLRGAKCQSSNNFLKLTKMIKSNSLVYNFNCKLSIMEYYPLLFATKSISFANPYFVGIVSLKVSHQIENITRHKTLVRKGR